MAHEDLSEKKSNLLIPFVVLPLVSKVSEY